MGSGHRPIRERGRHWSAQPPTHCAKAASCVSLTSDPSAPHQAQGPSRVSAVLPPSSPYRQVTQTLAGPHPWAGPLTPGPGPSPLICPSPLGWAQPFLELAVAAAETGVQGKVTRPSSPFSPSLPWGWDNEGPAGLRGEVLGSQEPALESRRPAGQGRRGLTPRLLGSSILEQMWGWTWGRQGTHTQREGSEAAQPQGPASAWPPSSPQSSLPGFPLRLRSGVQSPASRVPGVRGALCTGQVSVYRSRFHGNQAEHP